MKPTASQLSAISRLFSSAVIREMAAKGRSATFARLFSIAGIAEIIAPHATVGEGFDAAFTVLKTAGLRDEYVYRAAVTHKILMGTHSLKTASMLTEFRTGSSKADLVILNGTATVYEIKSERDSLSRLVAQIANYKMVFAAVNVIASEGHVKDVLDTVSSNVGVMRLARRVNLADTEFFIASRPSEKPFIDPTASVPPPFLKSSVRGGRASSRKARHIRSGGS